MPSQEPAVRFQALAKADNSLSRVSQYYQLIKPGIVYSNVMIGAASYLLASKWRVHWTSLFGLLFGTGLVIASACVFNNVIDRKIDLVMKRTKKRATASGLINVQSANSYAALLGLCGFIILSLTNLPTFIIGALAIIGYVILYGYAKRHSVYGTLVGALPGAASIAAGYTAATGRFNFDTIALIFIMIAWQMAHFYSIAIFRLSDYQKAKLPVWPAKRGIKSTQKQIMMFIVVFIGAVFLLSATHLANWLFGGLAGATGIYWLISAYSSRAQKDNVAWARKQFFNSLFVLLSLMVLLPVGAIKL